MWLLDCVLNPVNPNATVDDRHVIADRVFVDKIFSEDDTYEDDQDGLKVFAPHVDAGGEPIPAFLRVKESTFRNCYGRSIKSQTFFNSVRGVDFYRDEGFASGIGNSEVAFQISGGSIKDCNFYYSNGQAAGSLVLFSSRETSGGADYSLGTYSAEDLTAYLDGTQTLPTGVLTFPSEGLLGPVSVRRVDVVGGAVEELVDYLVNGDGPNNSLLVEDCYAAEIAPGVTTGNRALVRLRTSGSETPFGANMTIERCVYGGVNTAYVAEDSVAGSSVRAVTSMTGNLGFEDDHTSGFDDAGTKSTQATRVSALASKSGGGVIRPHAATISNGATETFLADLNQGAIFILQVRFNKDATAIFSADNNGTVSIHSGTGIALGGTTNPSSGTFNVWVSAAGELSVENTSGSNRRCILTEISPG